MLLRLRLHRAGPVRRIQCLCHQLRHEDEGSQDEEPTDGIRACKGDEAEWSI